VGRQRARRVEAAAARNDGPLTPTERTELAHLRKQVAEQEKDIVPETTLNVLATKVL
jgi:hypothetical protein